MRSNRVTRYFVILTAALAVSACGSNPEPVEDGSASGEVLEGSISDAMLPLDTVQSQSPPLEIPRADPTDPANPADPDAEEPEETTAEAEPAPEAEEPAPEE